uniref:Uncharacterized protein n=1 Tax=Arundo donax TaxID=35708 RepID=A0A0A9ANI4_ARUDO
MKSNIWSSSTNFFAHWEQLQGPGKGIKNRRPLRLYFNTQVRKQIAFFRYS